MRILLIGATGTIGSAIAAALRGRHEVIEVSRKKAAVTVDIADPESIRAMYKKVGKVDAVVSAAGAAKFAPLEKLSDDDFRFSLSNKLMGQVNVVRFGFDFVNDGGSFTVTSGVLAQQPTKGSAAISLVNSGVEGFARAAALEAPRNIRVNCVSPPWVSETLKAMGQEPSGGAPVQVVAQSYVRSIEGRESGLVIAAGK
jgi:NAD(P)-dependent dehydrogenase (short-subunit alcohol dehydrogenase family)